MTMIRINLIAEKKAGAPKSAKKAAATGSRSDLEENAILLGLILVAVAVIFVRGHFIGKELESKLTEERRLKKEYDSVKIWKDKQEEYELQRELLYEKIEKIKGLEDQRGGVVKVLEDLYNILPEQVWLQSIEQGYNKGLVRASDKGRTAYDPGRNQGDPNEFVVSGSSRSTDAASNFANSLAKLTTRYYEVDLNHLARNTKTQNPHFEFTLYFKVRTPAEIRKAEEAAEASGEGG